MGRPAYIELLSRAFFRGGVPSPKEVGKRGGPERITVSFIYILSIGGKNSVTEITISEQILREVDIIFPKRHNGRPSVLTSISASSYSKKSWQPCAVRIEKAKYCMGRMIVFDGLFPVMIQG